MYWLYNLLWLVALPAVACHLGIRRLLYHKYRRNLRPRLGLHLPRRRQPARGRVIWVHALSVGEVLAAVPLVRSLREKYPSLHICFSTTSEAGQILARQRLAGLDCQLLYLPLDLWWVVRRTVRVVGASLFLLVETDLWPNLVRYLERQNCPIVLVNGRVSDRSFARYLKVKKFFCLFFRPITVMCMQSQEDAQRMRLLGIPADNIRVSGNLKFDHRPPQSPSRERARLVRELGWLPTRVTWVAGSTHAGEEEMVLRIYSRLRRRFPDFGLILAPRHPERFQEVARLAQRSGWRMQRRSRMPEAGLQGDGADIILLDTIGELASFYCLGNFAFVGGTFAPAGGHNPLEASQRGLPVVFGPHMENFREIAAILTASGGGFQVRDEVGLFTQVESWLKEPARCREQGRRARQEVLSHQGAVARTMEVIEGLLENTDGQ